MDSEYLYNLSVSGRGVPWDNQFCLAHLDGDWATFADPAHESVSTIKTIFQIVVLVLIKKAIDILQVHGRECSA